MFSLQSDGPECDSTAPRRDLSLRPSLCVPLTFYVQSKMRWGGAVPLKQWKSCTPVRGPLHSKDDAAPPEKKHLFPPSKKINKNKRKKPPFNNSGFGRKRPSIPSTQTGRSPGKMWDVFADGQGMTDPLMTGSLASLCTSGLQMLARIVPESEETV